MTATGLRAFIRDSNRIEGILSVSLAEVQAHERLLARRPQIEVTDLVEFVAVIAPGKPLRNRLGLDVRVGEHVPLRGGAEVETRLTWLLNSVAQMDVDAYDAHVAYEVLHPFMDGNGRSGRALWVWMMQRDGLDPFALPFLHRFYYQTLDNAR